MEFQRRIDDEMMKVAFELRIKDEQSLYVEKVKHFILN